MLAIYARTSRYFSGELHTIDQQIEAGKAFAENHGISPENYLIFADEGISGYQTDDTGDPYANRPQFLALMELLDKGGIDSIWVWENSRLSRNSYASAYIYNKINKKNKERTKHHQKPIELWIQDSKYDLENPTDKLMKSIMDTFAEYERNMIVARTTRGLYKAIDEGRRSFSRFYGYTKGSRNASGNYEYLVNDNEYFLLDAAHYQNFYNNDNIKQVFIYADKNEANISLKKEEEPPNE
jgi:DNA invertase Pin-like site-specific DNA recombinase